MQYHYEFINVYVVVEYLKPSKIRVLKIWLEYSFRAKYFEIFLRASIDFLHRFLVLINHIQLIL